MTRTLFQRVQIWLIERMAQVSWNSWHSGTPLLTPEREDELKQAFAIDYYIIATRKRSYLTTFFIGMGNWFLTGRWGYYSHVLMNLEDEVTDVKDFRFIEATGMGIHFSTFEEVFGRVDAVALIKPKNMTIEEWTIALDKAKEFLGRPYDNLFDLKSDLEINCVELIRLALSGIPKYHEKFAEFEAMVAKKKKITPQMFLQCPDFETVLVIKR